MLDKHVPYAEIWMTRPLSDSLPTQSLATGYHFEYYRLGDETEWARIEQSVGEFATETEALAYFQRAFLPYQEELQQRMLFVVTDTGEKSRLVPLGSKNGGMEAIRFFIGCQ